MAQIKIEITFNTNEETLEQALAKLHAPESAPTAQTAKNEDAPKRKPAPAETGSDDAPDAKPDPKPAPDPAPEETPVTKTDVRAMATALTKAGKRDALKAIFKKFGGEKLSDIQEADYPALMKELVNANA